jgi:hypothetical protein
MIKQKNNLTSTLIAILQREICCYDSLVIVIIFFLPHLLYCLILRRTRSVCHDMFNSSANSSRLVLFFYFLFVLDHVCRL